EPSKVDQLRLIEREQVRAFGALLANLKSSNEADGSLLDRTMVLYGSNLGNASSHDTRNLPILLAGGGFRHGHHVAVGGSPNLPLSNLFITMLERLGLEVDQFGSSSGTLNELI